MTTHRVRASSPTAPRVYVDAPRASTGGILMTQAYDTRFDTRPRSSFSSIASSREGTSSRNNSVYETQPVSKRTYVDTAHPGGTISRTEYAVRPRRDSASADSRRPLSVVTKNVSPTRQRPPTISPAAVMYETPREIKDDTTRFLQPSQQRQSTRRERRSSATGAELDHYSIGSSSSRPDKGYHRRGPYVEKIADSRSPPPVRYSEDDAAGSFSYTTPRQQFERDIGSTTPRPGRRESLSRRERPQSAMAERFEHLPHRHNTGPPSAASRQLERIERDERRMSGVESDPDRSRDSRQIRNFEKRPIVHQREDGYSSARDDYDSRRSLKPRPYEDDATVVGRNRYHDANRDRDRGQRREQERERESGRPDRERDGERSDERRSERRKDREYDRERERNRPREYERIEQEDDSRRRPRSREASPDHSKLKTLATAAVGGLAAAGIANRKEKKGDAGSDSESKRERRHRRRKSRDRREAEKPGDEDYEERRRRRERHSHSQRLDESSGSDTPEDKASRRRPQSRTRRRDTDNGYGSDRDKPQLALPAPEPTRRLSRVPDEAASAEAPRERALERGPDRSQRESFTNNEGRTLSPGEGGDARPRKVTLVEPGKEKKEDVKPRGILKPPRMDPFPEDPNPQREGVAPLKQAGKDGVPPGARWTKISRMLVNPEALEKAQERFEERDDYVIVLRVVSREEIEKLAEKTREIREQRERDWQRQVEERRHRRAERGYPETEDEEDYNGPQQLTIEPPPAAPPVDLRQLAGQSAGTVPPVMPGAYAPQQWNNPLSARNSGDNVPVPMQAPMAQGIGAGIGGQRPLQGGQGGQGQGMPMQQQQQQQQEFDVSSYSQNV